MAVALALLEEVPFESAGQIEEKVELYERVLGPRYSKDDKYFAAISQKTENWYQVPVINPWPPARIQSRQRYEDWDSGRKRYRGRGGGRGSRGGGGGGRDREFLRDREFRDREFLRDREFPPNMEYPNSSRDREFPPKDAREFPPRDREFPSSSREFPPGSRDRGRGGWYEDYPDWQHGGRQSPRFDSYTRPPHPPFIRGNRDQLSPPPTPLSPPPPQPFPRPYAVPGHRGQSPPPPSLSPYSAVRRSRSRSPLQQGASPRRPSSSPWGHGASPRQSDPSPWRQENIHEDEENVVLPFGTTQLPSELHPQQPHPPEPLPSTPVTPGGEEPSKEEEEKIKQRPPPLDLKEVTGLSDQEEVVVPSKSDVLDILNVASIGVNKVNCDNLKQVQKETHLSVANRPTKNPRQRKRHESDSLSDELPISSRTHQGYTHEGHAPHTAKVKVSHGPRQDVSDLKSSDQLKSPAKKRQKVHHHHTGPDITAVPIDTGDKSHEKVSKPVKVKKGKVKTVSARSVLMADKDLSAEKDTKEEACSKAAKRPYIPDLSSEEEGTEEVDVTTPISADTSLSVSLKKSLIRLDAFDATKEDRPGEYMVSINRGTLPKPARRKSRDKDKTRDKEKSRDKAKKELIKSRTAKLAELSSEPLPNPEPLLNPVPAAPDDSGSYRVEFDGMSTKMIFRSGGAAEGTPKGEAVVGGVAKEKKAKKHHKKKKSKKSKSKGLEAGQDTGDTHPDIIGTCQDTVGARQDTVGAHQDTGSGASQDAGKMWFTDSLKVKIKLSGQTM